MLYSSGLLVMLRFLYWFIYMCLPSSVSAGSGWCDWEETGLRWPRLQISWHFLLFYLGMGNKSFWKHVNLLDCLCISNCICKKHWFTLKLHLHSICVIRLFVYANSWRQSSSTSTISLWSCDLNTLFLLSYGSSVLLRNMFWYQCVKFGYLLIYEKIFSWQKPIFTCYFLSSFRYWGVFFSSLFCSWSSRAFRIEHGSLFGNILLMIFSFLRIMHIRSKT